MQAKMVILGFFWKMSDLHLKISNDKSIVNWLVNLCDERRDLQAIVSHSPLLCPFERLPKRSVK